ncbi:MAG: zinc-ribbon domain-containing protein [bacterium]|nr:zinc-ribbon domain-containing protein [bacterium]
MTNKKKKKKQLSLMEAFPSLAIEWHQVKNKKLGPGDVTPDDSTQVWWECNQKHEWRAAVADRVSGACCPFCPRVTKPFLNMKTLAEAQPEAAKYWHPEKNGDRTLDRFSHKSAGKVWWKCEKGHEWYATIYSMRYKPRCRICYPGKRTSPDYNLAVKKPRLARQWHPTKNGTLTPSDIAPYSAQEVWWKCRNGHEWIAKPVNRRIQPYCPHCRLEKRRKSYHLEVMVPEIVSLWHPSKNGDRKPSDFTPGSIEKVWWKCEKGHEFERGIGSMKNNQTCPVCNKIQRNAKHNLLVQNPELAREWHPVKNGDLTPDKVRPHSEVKVWWLCPNGHEYQATLGNRNRGGGKGRGCPYCSGRKDLSKESLAILLPELAKEWHRKKNGDLTPENVSTISTRLVWWRCKKGHQWQATIKSRTLNKKYLNCPRCDI